MALVPPIVVQDELKAGVLPEWQRLDNVVESFFAVVHKRRFPNPQLRLLLPGRAPMADQRALAV